MADTEITRDSILAKVEIDAATGCWIWIGSAGNHGYGHVYFRRGGRWVHASAHRSSYQVFVGPIPCGMFVCHHCDVKRCVNPDHLFLGTARENTHDALAKGRLAAGDRHYSRLQPERLSRGERHYTRTHPEKTARGERQHDAKLTAAAVVEARELRAEGMSWAAIGRRFGVSDVTITRAIKRITWRHVP